MSNATNYKWFILVLAAITATFVVAISASCMPALFNEIMGDLHLDKVQIGTIWGMGSLAGFVVSLLAGFLGDRFGARKILIISCFLAGITGALRGLSNDYFTLAATVFVSSLTRAIIPIVFTKMIGIWFKGRNLGMANGVGAMGMGLGLMLGPMISATVLSPWLGGWRNVLFLYGAVAVFVGVLWFLFGKEPQQAGQKAEVHTNIPIRESLSVLTHNKAIWLTGLTIMFRSACIIGMTGYLPLYLIGRGWTEASADTALAAFYGASTLFVIPLSIISDRLGSRKAVLFPAIVLSIVCVGLLPLANGIAVWILVILAGATMDGFMAIITSSILETGGIERKYTGTALGLVFTIAQIGGMASPPLGNKLATINEVFAFIFWAAASIPAIFTLLLCQETGWKRKQPLKATSEET